MNFRRSLVLPALAFLARLVLIVLIPLLLAVPLLAQQIGQLPRITPTTGLADSALFMCTDSTKVVTRACKFSDLQKRFSFKAWDSLLTAKLNLTGATITGSPTWSSTFTAASGQRVDSATGAARAQILTTARTIGGVSFNGSANIIPDTATGVVRAQTLTTSRALWGQSFNGSAAITGSLTSVGDISGGASSMNLLAGTGASRRLVIQTTTSGSTATTAVRFNEVQQSLFASGSSARPGIAFASDTTSGFYLNGAGQVFVGRAGTIPIQFGATVITNAILQGQAQWQAVAGTAAAPGLAFVGDTNSGVYGFGADSVGVATGGVHTLAISGGASTKLTGGAGSMTTLCGTGNSRTCTFQTTTSSGTAKNVLVLGADSTATFLGAVTAAGVITSTKYYQTTNDGSVGTLLDLINTDAGATTDKSARFFRNGSEAGNISTTLALVTTYNSTSDQRLKKDLGVARDPAVLRNLVVHDFLWLTDGRTIDRGVFAQEAYRVKGINPNAVHVGSDKRDGRNRLADPWGFDYSKLIPDVVVGWQAHDAQISALLVQVAKQQKTIDSLVAAGKKKP